MGVVEQMSSADSREELDTVGRRVSCDGERGTVCYVGVVPPTAGVWLGVEWDNPERGKHDGSHEGVQYFTCRHPTGGSFVRQKKASFGVDFLSALRDSYQFNVEEVCREETSIFSKTLEMKGFENIRFESLTAVTLKQREVNGPGPVGQPWNAMPHVTTLDLAINLLSSWEDVAAITQNMVNLKVLLLSYNRLRVTPDPALHTKAFSSLTVLSLTNCQLTWTQLLQCAPMWPCLEELYVSENDITQLTRPVDLLQHVRVLDLSSNLLVENSVLSLASLPRLETLNLSKTGLSALQFEDVPPGHKTSLFPALKVLLLNDNNISQWSVVNELDKLPSLVQLSCRHNDLLTKDVTRQTANQLLIAKLGQVIVLNGCKVLAEDRRGAELDYIKMFGEEWLKEEGGGHRDPEESLPSGIFPHQHPRYQTLIDKYGAPVEGDLKKKVPFALKNQLISLRIVCPEDEGRTPIIKKLPDSMTIQKLKGLLSRLLKVPGAMIKLSYTGPKIEGSEVDIDNDLKPLLFYSVEEGDTLLVRRA